MYGYTLDQIRRIGSMSQQEAAALCCVDVRTYRRWERGQHTIPGPALKLMKLYAGGQLDQIGGPAWRGYRIIRGRFFSPAGVEFSAGEIAAIPYFHSLIAELRRRLREYDEKTIIDEKYQDIIPFNAADVGSQSSFSP